MNLASLLPSSALVFLAPGQLLSGSIHPCCCGCCFSTVSRPCCCTYAGDDGLLFFRRKPAQSTVREARSGRGAPTGEPS
ncbi:hypothetical protein VPH35_063660 [Triticum aestivum]